MSSTNSYDRRRKVENPREPLVQFERALLPYLTKCIDLQQRLVNKTVERSAAEEKYTNWDDKPASPVVRAGPMEKSRLLLSQLGVLGYEVREHARFVDHTEAKTKRYIKEFDKAFECASVLPLDLSHLLRREITKVGLIYVASGQEDERDMFRNQVASTLYQEFARGMGALV